MAECHPVGFQWVMEAKARGATVIHIDPRYTRTSAVADLHVPLRAGSDIVLLGGLINYVLSSGKYFRDYVVNYTNAATIISEDFKDTEDLDGLFSGFDADSRSYDPGSWMYEGTEVQAASGERDAEYDDRVGSPSSASPSADPSADPSSVRQAARGEAHGSGGAHVGTPRTDPALEHPRCVFQLLKRHFARYSPEMVEQACGIPRAAFDRICAAITANSGRDRTTAFVYSVGWTQHTVGVQYIRAASILQTLLGNIGRPGGGILALRGHASIQGSTDIPTLFDLLPGYIPMPHAHTNEDLDSFIAAEGTDKGFWANMRAYTVSLLKAWWGDAATEANDFCFDYLPRLTGSHSTYETVMAQLAGDCEGYFLLGENPAVGSANGKLQRLGMANLKWLVVRDFSLIESATFWKDGPEIDSGELRTADIGTEVFFMPAAAHTEKNGSFTNTQRMLQWHHAAVEPAGDARSELWFAYHLGRLIRSKLAGLPDGLADEMDRPVLDLTWDYPVAGTAAEPSAEAVLAEVNGWDGDGKPLSAYTELKDDGSTACGCWIYCGVYSGGVNQAARRKPGREQNWIAPEWGWAWPANRRILYNRASADPEGRPWSERKALVWWDAEAGKWTGHDVPDFVPDKAPSYRPPEDATGPAAHSGTDPFIMQADGKAWLYAPAGLVDGPLPAHYEPQDSPVANALYAQQRNPVRQAKAFMHPENLFQPSNGSPGSPVFPYVATTYRLTEHHTAGGMSRWLPYLSELQPEFFCEVSPELAAERGLDHLGWATIVTARNAVEARVLVTERMHSLTIAGRRLHQVGLPYHWGWAGYSTGDSANDLVEISLDPNVHIQESKAFACDIRPGRRPRGAARPALVREYQQRAGITERTGTEP
jgi:formate dehydrogenase major subunit